MEALQCTTVIINERICKAMVDCGCTKTLVHKDWCGKWERKDIEMLTITGKKWKCLGVARVQMKTEGGLMLEMEVNVLETRPFGFSCVLGLDAIRRLGGVTIYGDCSMRFCAEGHQCNPKL